MPRFVTDGELLALMRRASLVVLPYREIDQSGVPSPRSASACRCCSATSAASPRSPPPAPRARCPRAIPSALREALEELLGDPAALAAMAERARAAAAGEYAWEAIARRTLALYESLPRRESRAMRTALEIVFWLSVGLIVWTQLGYAAALAAARARASARGSSARERRRAARLGRRRRSR